jgi:hypothetical protein
MTLVMFLVLVAARHGPAPQGSGRRTGSCQQRKPELNARGITAPRGGKWLAPQVASPYSFLLGRFVAFAIPRCRRFGSLRVCWSQHDQLVEADEVALPNRVERRHLRQTLHDGSSLAYRIVRLCLISNQFERFPELAIRH